MACIQCNFPGFPVEGLKLSIEIDFLLIYSICSLLKIKLTLDNCSPPTCPRIQVNRPALYKEG